MLRFIFIFILIGTRVLSQTAPSYLWQTCIGGSKGDGASHISPTFRHTGFVVSGQTQSPDGYFIGYHNDSLLNFDLDATGALLDQNGNIVWARCYGGTAWDRFWKVIPIASGGYLLAGETYSMDGDVIGQHLYYDTINNQWRASGDVWVVKTDSGGGILWQHCYGGSGGDGARAIAATTDGGFLIGGSSGSVDGDVSPPYDTKWGNALLLKIDSAGTLLWSHSYGDTIGGDGITDIVVNLDGSFLVSGSKSSSPLNPASCNHGYYDAWLMKLDSAGDSLWEHCYGGTGEDIFESIKSTYDGGYIVGGSSYSNDGDVTGYHPGSAIQYYDYWLVKVDSIGFLQWEKCYGGSQTDGITDIVANLNQTYSMVGITQSSDGDIIGHLGISGSYDGWIIEVDSVGNILWSTITGSLRNDFINGITLDEDEGWVVCGTAGDSTGNVTAPLWSPAYNGDQWIFKLAPYNVGINEIGAPQNLVQVIPNPIKNSCTITAKQFTNATLNLYDITGRALLQQKFNASAQLDIGFLSAGVYLIELKNKEGVSVKSKIVKQ